MNGAGRTAERVGRNALLKVAVQGTRLLSLVFVILAARALGPEGFGKFTFAYTLATVLGAALDLGMPSLLIRGVARAPTATAAQWIAAVTLKLSLLAPAGLIFGVVPILTHRPPDTTIAAWLLGTAIALQAFIELVVSVFTAFERLEFELGLRVVEKVLLIALGLTGLALGGGLLVVSGVFALAALAALALGVFLVHRHFARLGWRWDPPGARALARELGPVAIAFVLAFAATRLVPLLVAVLAGDVAAGYFGAAVRVLDVLAIVPVALVAAVYPVLARTAPSDPRFRRAIVLSTEFLLLVGVPLALVLAYGGAHTLTAGVYGARYAPTAPLLQILGLAVCLNFLNYFLAFVFIAADRPRRLVAIAAVSLVASGGLTPGLVLALGAAGGAVALVLVETVALTGTLAALAPLVGLPFGIGALKTGVAAAGAVLVAQIVLAGGPWQLVAAMLAYAGGVVALRPVPVALWGRLVRGGLWASGRP